jgi:hypothetical protein
MNATATQIHEIEADYMSHGRHVIVMWCPLVERSVIAEQIGPWQMFCSCGAQA